MLKNEILNLQKDVVYPSITILMPTSRITVDTNKEKILLKNLINELEEKLKHKVDKKNAEVLLQKVRDLANEIDFFNMNDGLGIFVNEKKSFIIKFPFTVPALVVIDDTFETKYLIKQYNRSIEYYLLNLNEKETSLFLGFNEIIEPIKNDDFPFSIHDIVEISYEQGTWHYDSAMMEKVKQYLREANRRAKNNIENESPLVIAGVNKIVSLFEDLSDYKLIIGKIEGSYDSKSLHELGKKANAIVQKYLNEIREKVFKEFLESFGYKKATFGLLDVWNLANEGRIETLLVEENYHQPARFEGNQPILVQETNDSLLIEDLVDETIELVFKQKGKVYFYEDGRLNNYSRIGAILRY
ncbi:MAG: hypothetical protein N3F03_06340 [Ignavibacteria bacterium]|nr:hypothetical protein [Ignavibacteria bacterium]